MKKVITAFAYGVILSALMLTTTAQASTSDTICSPLKNQVPGLYGLCVAFCSAHETELELSDDLKELENLNQSQLRLYNNYQRKRGEDGPQLPCVHMPTVLTCSIYDEHDLNTKMTEGSQLFIKGSDGYKPESYRRTSIKRGYLIPGLTNPDETCTVQVAVTMHRTFGEVVGSSVNLMYGTYHRRSDSPTCKEDYPWTSAFASGVDCPVDSPDCLAPCSDQLIEYIDQLSIPTS
ncbi:MAG: hypothetical protein D3923_11220 [Candidatus Electrothrix sp. AR3]|nr:hypothetical protein [Candidatus Electrothrix sp. AR3]